MKEDIVAVSLFSGAGGLDIASVMAGVPVILSTDFDADCIRTLKENRDYFGNTEIFEGDLHQIESDVFLDVVKKNNPKKHFFSSYNHFKLIDKNMPKHKIT